MATKKETWKTLLHNKSNRGTEYYDVKIITNGTVKIEITHRLYNAGEDFKGEIFQDNEWKFLFWKMDMGDKCYTDSCYYGSDLNKKELRTVELMEKGMEFINVMF